MPIYPLPQFEADLEADRRDRETYERLKPPSSIVVRYGVMKLVGEFPYSGDAKPGCGSKIVIRTHRGTELGEMLTSTCPNSGCSKSVSRQEMLQYIENSGGRDYPFSTDGRVLRIATSQDLAEQSRLEGMKPSMVRVARDLVAQLKLPMKIVEAEPILGSERLTLYFTSEERIDFRELVHELSRHYGARIDLRQVGARDEARLVADYERCGQHCCCKQFLKVLKPISIKSAKTQKATLDPLKISGRCGRLMCCLRYEDETYNDLVKRLPKLRKPIGTPLGVGVVIDRQILTQLVLVRLDHDGKDVAFPVEELMPPDQAPPPGGVPAPREDPLRGMPASRVEKRVRDGAPDAGAPARSGEPNQRQQRHRDRAGRPPRPAPGAAESSAELPDTQRPQGDSGEPATGAPGQDAERRRRRRRRRRGSESQAGEPGARDGAPRLPRPPRAPGEGGSGQSSGAPDGSSGGQASGESGGEARRRRKRRRRKPGSGGPGGSGGSGGGGGPGGPGGSGGGSPFSGPPA